MQLTMISDAKNNQQNFWNGKMYGTHVKVHTIYYKIWKQCGKWLSDNDINMS